MGFGEEDAVQSAHLSDARHLFDHGSRAHAGNLNSHALRLTPNILVVI